ncbi:flagellin [Pelagibacterium montanilacus]|uniref:flagellin N-terminal helical domain-containing protein n=1 Tax=Pelagibacterium montanilacus TaxID=2185280 RepID=UPI0013E04AB1|nr:flagellin [Pelagibacterium montanilacus]
MSDVTLSKAVRSNLLHLQGTATMMDRTQERLATGLKVNSALDNPTNFFTASSLKARSKDLDLLMDAISNGVQTLQAADKGISAIQKLVESAQATARQAMQTTPRVDTTQTAVLQEAVATGTVAIGADSAALATGSDLGANTGTDLASGIVAHDDVFSITVDGDVFTIGINDTDGGGGFTGTADLVIDLDFSSATVDDVIAGLNGAMTSTEAAGISPALADFSIGLDGANQLAVTTSENEISFSLSGFATGFGIADGSFAPSNAQIAGLSGTLTIGTQTATFGAGNIETRAQLEDWLAGLTGDVSAEIDTSSDTLVVTGANGASVAIGGTLDTVAAFGIAQQTYSAQTETTTVNVPNPVRREMVEQYNAMLEQISNLTRDASYNGVNLLIGDSLDLIFNEDGTSRLNIEGGQFDAAGLGLTPVANEAFDENADIETVLDGLKGAIDSLRAQASRFGSNMSVVEARQNFTKEMINTLETGAADLTLADTNEEAANMLALQTRQQLSQTALSLASQADQAVLRLFG